MLEGERVTCVLLERKPTGESDELDCDSCRDVLRYVRRWNISEPGHSQITVGTLWLWYAPAEACEDRVRFLVDR